MRLVVSQHRRIALLRLPSVISFCHGNVDLASTCANDTVHSHLVRAALWNVEHRVRALAFRLGAFSRSVVLPEDGISKPKARKPSLDRRSSNSNMLVPQLRPDF